MYDAIVVGARCAGSPTAMLLARKGYRVLLVDKAIFPSDILNNHYIHQPGVAYLQRWGLLAAVRASGCPPIRTITLAVGPHVLSGTPPPTDTTTDAYAPRRLILDALLVSAAEQAGVELREGFVVDDCLWDGDRVTGIRGHTRDGGPVTEQARIIIGADGMHSRIARTVQAPAYWGKATLSCVYYTYWDDLQVKGLEIALIDQRAVVALPTNDDLTLIAVSWPYREFQAVRKDIAGHYAAALASFPDLLERVQQSRQVERFKGTADMPNFFRKPYGAGWALVGDAGYHKDPATAQGISDSFRDAELLTEAIDAGFSDRQPLNEALAQYEQRRNAAALPMYEFTCELAALAPPSAEQMQLFAALSGNPMETNRFLGAMAGTVSIPEFFAPGNIRRIIEGREV